MWTLILCFRISYNDEFIVMINTKNTEKTVSTLGMCMCLYTVTQEGAILIVSNVVSYSALPMKCH